MENHSVQIDNREKMTITDIREIYSFDEEEIRASLRQGAMVIRGEDLHIHMLDLTEGTAQITGVIHSLMSVSYTHLETEVTLKLFTEISAQLKVSVTIA